MVLKAKQKTLKASFQMEEMCWGVRKEPNSL